MKRSSILSLVVILIISVFPVGQAQQPLDTASIDAYITNHITENQIPGLAISIVHNDEIVYTQGYGVTGPEGLPVTPQTPFILGSTSKSFTALAVMQLVEAGDIELDATVETYLPWFTMADPEKARLITVRHLLTHSSGLSGPVSDKDLVNPDVNEDALETHIRELVDYDLARPAGEGYEYNNAGYDILGLIVQTVSGETFEDYIEKYIYSPLEMTTSYASKEEADANGLAVGHTYFFGRPRVANAPYPRRKLPSGFLIASAEDLGHYLIAQLNEGRYEEAQILSPENVALLHQPAVETFDKGVSYAFGWRIHLVEGESFVWHGGDTSSYHSNMVFSPTLGWGVAIVMNVAGLPQSAALNEPIKQVFRLSSGYNTGQEVDDMESLFYVIWGIAIFSIVLNLGYLRKFLQRTSQDSPLNLVRYLILPLGYNLLLVYLMFVWFPSSNDSNIAVMFAFVPDTSLIFVASTLVNVLTMLTRIVVYLRAQRSHQTSH